MALTFDWIDGFEHQTVSTAGAGIFNTLGAAAPTIVTTGLRAVTGAAALQVAPNGTNPSNAQKTLTGQAKRVMRFAFKITTLPSSTQVAIARFTAATAGAVTILRVNSSSGRLDASLDSTAWTNGPTLTVGSWYVIEVRIDMSANPWVMDWRYKADGGSWSNQTQVTRAVAADTITIAWLGTSAGSPAATMVYDDWAIATFTVSTDWIGDGYSKGFTINADGAHSVGADTFRFTTNNGTGYTNITNATTNSYPACDNLPIIADGNAADAWVEKQTGTTQANYVEYDFPTSAEGKDINAMMALIAFKASSSTASGSNMQGTVWDGTTENDIFNSTIGSTTTIYKTKVYNQTPSSAAWTEALFNGCRFRMHNNAVTRIPRLKAAQFQVDYTLETSVSPITASPAGSATVDTAALTGAGAMSASPAAGASLATAVIAGTGALSASSAGVAAVPLANIVGINLQLITASITAAASLTTAALTGAGALAGSAPGVAALPTAVLAGAGALAGSLVSGAALPSGALAGTGALAGSVAGAASLATAVLVGKTALTASVSGAGAVSLATLVGTGALAGSAAGVAALSTGVLVGTGALAGNAAGTASLTLAALKGTGALTGSLAGAASVTANITLPGLSSNIAAGATLDVAALKGAGSLGSTVPSSGSVTAGIRAQGALTGSAAALSAVTATLGQIVSISATIAAGATITAGLGATMPISADISSTADVIANIIGSLPGQLNASISASAFVQAVIRGVPQPVYPSFQPMTRKAVETLMQGAVVRMLNDSYTTSAANVHDLESFFQSSTIMWLNDNV